MEQLHINQVFKSFKALCDFLEIPYNNDGGKQKLLAEKKVRRIVNFEKLEHSHRVVITEIK